MSPNESRAAGLAPWVAGFALGALALLLLRPGAAPPAAPAVKKEEPTPAPRVDPGTWTRPTPVPAASAGTSRRAAGPAIRDERAADEAESSAMRAAVRAALDSFHAESYFEQKAGLLYNTVSGCRLADQTWPTASNPRFSASYACKVVDQDLRMNDRTFELRGSVEKRDGRWQVDFQGDETPRRAF